MISNRKSHFYTNYFIEKSRKQNLFLKLWLCLPDICLNNEIVWIRRQRKFPTILIKNENQGKKNNIEETFSFLSLYLKTHLRNTRTSKQNDYFEESNWIPIGFQEVFYALLTVLRWVCVRQSIYKVSLMMYCRIVLSVEKRSAPRRDEKCGVQKRHWMHDIRHDYSETTK